MVIILLASALFLLAFVFLDMSHEALKKRIRRISGKKMDDPCPRELDYPFFRLGGPGSARAPWQRYSRRETQIADRDDFIRQTAPELAECLDAIGAEKQKEMFVKFVTDNGIDLNDLSSFEINSIYEYEAQEKRYPFDDYDDAFSELESVSVPLMKFVREHISEF